MTEARQVKLEELVPKALLVLERHLSSESEQICQRAAEHVLDRCWGRPQQPVSNHVDLPDRPFAEYTREERAELRRVITQKLEGLSFPELKERIENGTL